MIKRSFSGILRLILLDREASMDSIRQDLGMYHA